MNGRVQRTLMLSSLLLAAMPMAPAGAGGGCHSEETELNKAVAATEVTMKYNCFTPAVLAVDPGATVRFTNKDPINHVVVGTRWAASDEIAPDGTAEHRFTEPGSYPYSCYLHPGMNGVILVGAPAPAPAADAKAPTTLAASSGPSGDSDVGPLSVGALAGLAVGATVSSRRLRGLLRR